MIIFGLFFSLNTVAKNKIYKWVDAQGVVHYSKDKPENVPTSVVKIYKSKSTEPKNTEKDEKATTAQDDEKLTPEQQATKEYNEKERQRVQEVQNRENCKIAQKNLKTLQNAGRIQKTNPATGETFYVDNPERENMLALTKKRIQDLCQ